MVDFADIKKTVDNMATLMKRVAEFENSDVLAGVPAAKAGRRGDPANNAMLAYIHEFGSPAQHIPARPFIHPGIRSQKRAIVAGFRQAGIDALRGTGNLDASLNQIGMLARQGMINAITNPQPPFVPLQPATIRARLRKTGAGRRQYERLKKNADAAGMSLAQVLSDWGTSPMAGGGTMIKPLIDTGQLRAALTYVVVKNGRRR